MIRPAAFAAIVVSAFALTTLPASAKMMGCTGDNMAKTQASVMAMPDSPGKFGAEREIGMANTSMSKGDMRGACMHYMNAQKMGSMGMMMGGRM